MEKDKIGTILRDRIQELGYTQTEFAIKSGIGLSSLKKYMRGENAYNYEVLDILATELDCSYDYLLGKSKSPRREFHEVTEQTHLSEEAIEKIFKHAKEYENSFEARRYIKVLDLMLRDEIAFSWICDFMISSKPMDAVNDLLMEVISMLMTMASNTTVQVEDVIERKIPLESTVMVHLIMSLKALKDELTPEFVEEIKELALHDEVCECIEQLKPLLTLLVTKRNEAAGCSFLRP